MGVYLPGDVGARVVQSFADDLDINSFFECQSGPRVPESVQDQSRKRVGRAVEVVALLLARELSTESIRVVWMAVGHCEDEVTVLISGAGKK